MECLCLFVRMYICVCVCVCSMYGSECVHAFVCVRGRACVCGICVCRVGMCVFMYVSE